MRLVLAIPGFGLRDEVICAVNEIVQKVGGLRADGSEN